VQYSICNLLLRTPTRAPHRLAVEVLLVWCADSRAEPGAAAAARDARVTSPAHIPGTSRRSTATRSSPYNVRGEALNLMHSAAPTAFAFPRAASPDKGDRHGRQRSIRVW